MSVVPDRDRPRGGNACCSWLRDGYRSHRARADPLVREGVPDSLGPRDCARRVAMGRHRERADTDRGGTRPANGLYRLSLIIGIGWSPVLRSGRSVFSRGLTGPPAGWHWGLSMTGPARSPAAT
jgi:hypothetical protein